MNRNQMGSYQLKITLTDTYNAKTEYPFKVNVYDYPRFSPDVVKYVTVHINEVFIYNLPVVMESFPL